MPNALDMIDSLHLSKSVQAQTKAAKNDKAEQLKNACSEFESLFVNYMMQQMRQTVPENGLFSKSQAEKIYTGMMDGEIARSVSHGRGLGLAKIMCAQMSAMHGKGGPKK
ncbi:MAG: rod-binding protein [Desulfobacteraceae bacterium]|jgi:flagellar protein FlgJ